MVQLERDGRRRSGRTGNVETGTPPQVMVGSTGRERSPPHSLLLQDGVDFLVAETADGRMDLSDAFYFDAGKCGEV